MWWLFGNAPVCQGSRGPEFECPPCPTVIKPEDRQAGLLCTTVLYQNRDWARYWANSICSRFFFLLPVPWKKGLTGCVFYYFFLPQGKVLFPNLRFYSITHRIIFFYLADKKPDIRFQKGRISKCYFFSTRLPSTTDNACLIVFIKKTTDFYEGSDSWSEKYLFRSVKKPDILYRYPSR